ncbi:hypothetical protein EX895_006057 [Sporisorium graminicola]|uniref:Uncharacterized protein n=1 Tax=Sporisorium graminicola TaxID=280036 RepID=A0A4U7KME4_9BASI|nr:hypothetical protein EX895_006057 [Sporisorium graminicola]TKY84977.1 hypothetical protein EX895_006057 [Sporisorium graminicola]
MTPQLSSKGLPPPPLRIDKRNMSDSNQNHGGSQQWPMQARATAGSSHLSAASEHNDASTKLSRTPSGRFRIRVPSLTKQAKSTETAQNAAPLLQNAQSQPVHSQSQNSGKVWQPRWAPRLKRTNPSESVTTYSPILDAPLPPLPSSMASPPPAVKLDDTGFGRPFSTAGLLDLNASRFSFLDMSNMDHENDADSDDSHGAPALVNRLPTICEPPTSQHGHSKLPLSSASSATNGLVEPATASSSLQPSSSREMLKVLQSPTSVSGQDTPSPHVLLPTSSPALASLISSFPSPLTRDRALPPAPSSSHLLPTETMQSSNATSGTAWAAAMKKENSWDGGERWRTDGLKHGGLPTGRASTELPYLDMDDDDSGSELVEAAPANPSSASMQPQLRPSSISPTKSRPVRNPPPRPAPNMALPDLPARASAAVPASVRRHTPTSSIQLDMQQQTAGPASASSSKSVQRPLILPSLRSSTSIDRLAALGSSSSSPLDEAALAKTTNRRSLKPLTLSRSASTDELAKSLDIPRETVKQMLETTQHVWRNHLLGSVAMHLDQPITGGGLERLPRSSSSPVLSTMFASQASSDSIAACEDPSKGSVAKPPAGKSSNRASMLGLPYISSSRPSFEHQSPGWAVTKHSMDSSRPSMLELQAERARHRRTFLARSSEDGPTANYNFSRPIPRDANGTDSGLAASASMPSLAMARQAPKPPALLQSPLLLKGESEATGFAQFVADDEQEILVDSNSEAHQSFALARALQPRDAINFDKTTEAALSAAKFSVHKPVPALPLLSSGASPRLVRRNSDTVLNRFAPEFGKRAPGELHAWSVCIDDDGVPAIRPSQSAFHRPSCPLAGKNNATWQCGCRNSFSHNADMSTPSLSVPGQSSPGRNRSLSAGNAMDPIRQAQLWGQVEKNKELIRKHQQEIAGLQEQVVRISTEMTSARPSFSSAFATPDLASVTAFPAPPARASASISSPFSAMASPRPGKPAVPAKTTSVTPFPAWNAASTPLPDLPKTPPTQQAQPPRTLRGRIASLSKISLAKDSEDDRLFESSKPSHSRLRSSSSTSSLNKVFRFPWSRSSDKEQVFPEPTPFTLGDRRHSKAHSSVSLREKALPRVRMYSVDESRPLPAPPLQDAAMSGKDKRYPPSSRKFSYDMLRGPAMHSSVGSRHLRGRSGSSKSSSFGTSIFSSNESHDMHETSRFASFPRFGRRWDSISSRGTNASARNSAEVSTQPNGYSFGSMPALSSVAAGTGKLMPALPIEADTGLRQHKDPPPRRSSLLRKSLEAAPRRTPIPSEFLQANEGGMAPISELSEVGSPASGRIAPTRADPEMSPVSFTGASPAGPVRMSMSERYRLQGLTVPAPLALSSSLTSPALGSAAEPGSGTKVGEGPSRSPTSPRSARSPLPVGFSHGALTVARRPSLSTRS